MTTTSHFLPYLLAEAELTREIFGNISTGGKVVFYIMAAISMGIFVLGVVNRWRLWRIGKRGSIRFAPLPALRQFLSRAMTQRSLRKQNARKRGLATLAHALLFYGFVVLTIGTVLVAIEHYAHDLIPGYSSKSRSFCCYMLRVARVRAAHCSPMWGRCARTHKD